MCVSICLPPGYGEKRREREAGRAAGGAAGITCVCVCVEERQRCRGRDRGRGIKYVIVDSVLFRGLFSFNVRFAVKTIYAHVSMLAYL